MFGYCVGEVVRKRFAGKSNSNWFKIFWPIEFVILTVCRHKQALKHRLVAFFAQKRRKGFFWKSILSKRNFYLLFIKI